MSVVPEASKELLDTLPGVKTVEVTAKYPIAEGEHWNYIDSMLQVAENTSFTLLMIFRQKIGKNCACDGQQNSMSNIKYAPRN